MASFEWPPGLEGGLSGVTSLNGLTGTLTLVAGTGITITPSGSNITISASTGLPAPLEALASYTSNYWGAPSTFLGNLSDSDQVNSAILLGSTDTAIANHTTSTVILGCGDQTATAATSGPGGVNVNGGDVVNGIANAGGIFVGGGSADAGLGGDVEVQGGNSNGSFAGGVILKTGTGTGPSRGKISFKDGSEGTSGYVWASTNTTGAGTWLNATASSSTSSVVKRDSHGNFQTNNIETGVTSTASAGTTTTLTVASSKTQIMTGSTNQTYALPDATTLVIGTEFDFINSNSATGQLTLKDGSGTTLYTATPLCTFSVICTNIGSTAGVWMITPKLNASTSSGIEGLVLPSGQYYGFGTTIGLSVGNYSLGGDGASYTLLNVATGGTIYHRVANSTIMSMTSAGLDMASHKITSVTDPTSAQDAATKNYVDTHGGGTPHNSNVKITTPTGFGSSGVRTRTYSASSVTGTDISYTSDATNGDIMTINTTGVYCLSFADGNSINSATYMGVVSNANNTQKGQDFSGFLSQVIFSSTTSQSILGYANIITYSAYLTAGTTLTFQYDSSISTSGFGPNFSNAYAFFSVTRTA